MVTPAYGTTHDPNRGRQPNGVTAGASFINPPLLPKASIVLAYRRLDLGQGETDGYKGFCDGTDCHPGCA